MTPLLGIIKSVKPIYNFGHLKRNFYIYMYITPVHLFLQESVLPYVFFTPVHLFLQKSAIFGHFGPPLAGVVSFHFGPPVCGYWNSNFGWSNANGHRVVRVVECSGCTTPRVALPLGTSDTSHGANLRRSWKKKFTHSIPGKTVF